MASALEMQSLNHCTTTGSSHPFISSFGFGVLTLCQKWGYTGEQAWSQPQGAHTRLVWIVPHWRYVSRGTEWAYHHQNVHRNEEWVSGQSHAVCLCSEMVTAWILDSSPLRRWFSTGGNLLLKEHLENSGGIFYCHS